MAVQPENSNFKTQFTQFDIVELALSLKLTEKIKKKNGDYADFIDILKGIEILFNCKINEPYIVVHKLFNRKKNITLFIDNLRTKILDEDEKRLNK